MFPNKGNNPRKGMSSEGFQSVVHNYNHRERSHRPPTPSKGERDGARTSPHPGPVTMEISQRNAQVARLQAERDRLQRADAAAQGEISGLKAKLGQAESEKATLLRDIDKLTLERDEQRIANKKLQEQISKQKTTIKVQSDQIAQRNSAGKINTTPHRGGANPGQFTNIYNQPPPAYNAPPLAGPSPPPATPVTCPRNTNSFLNGPPPPVTPMARQRSTPGSTSTTPKRDVSRGPSRGPPVPKSPLEQSPGDRQLSKIQEAEPSVEMSAEFAKVFRLTEVWAHNYTNIPDPEDVLPAQLQSSLVQFANPTTALKLVSSGSTRYLAIAKLINYQITTLMYRPLIAKGYTDHYDKRIAEMRTEYYKIVPIHVRRALMTAVADMFREMTSEKPFREYIEKRISYQTYDMWSFLEPLFGPGVSRNEAWNDLTEIWNEAARVGILMLLKRSSFQLDYPLIGSSSLFNPAQMISRDVKFRQDPQTLAKMGVTIRLAITPVITETDYMANEPTPRTLHLSNVLLEVQ